MKTLPPRAHGSLETRGKDGNVIATIITKAHYTGRTAKSATWIDYPRVCPIFLSHGSSRYGTTNHVELITDSKPLPGLIGVREELRRTTPDSLRGYDEYWIDPTHSDRLVQHTEESFEDPPPPNTPPGAFIASTGRFKSVTEFSDYATLSDGREYAQISATTDYQPRPNGDFVPTSSRSTTFQLLPPNRILPPLKIPAAPQLRQSPITKHKWSSPSLYFILYPLSFNLLTNESATFLVL